MNSLNIWWSTIPPFEQLFWYFAIPASLALLILLALTLIGIDDLEFDADIDGDGFFDDFPLLSIRNLISFFTLFGWVGIAMSRDGHGSGITIITAFSAGMTSVLFMTFLMKQLKKMASSGNMDMRDAIGTHGEVYLPIPEKRSSYGKVTVSFGGKLHEMKALTAGEAIETGTPIVVKDVINDQLLVERISA